MEKTIETYCTAPVATIGNYYPDDMAEFPEQQQTGHPQGPGKRVHRISIFRIAGSEAIHCMVYHIVSAGSFEIRSTHSYLNFSQYNHLANVVNRAAERSHGRVEAHNAVPGFVWLGLGL